MSWLQRATNDLPCFTPRAVYCETPDTEFDEAKCVDSTVEIVVQLNGKIKSRIVVPTAATKDELLAAAKADAVVMAEMAGKNIVKEIVVPGKLVNIVVK